MNPRFRGHRPSTIGGGNSVPDKSRQVRPCVTRVEHLPVRAGAPSSFIESLRPQMSVQSGTNEDGRGLHRDAQGRIRTLAPTASQWDCTHAHTQSHRMVATACDSYTSRSSDGREPRRQDQGDEPRPDDGAHGYASSEFRVPPRCTNFPTRDWPPHPLRPALSAHSQNPYPISPLGAFLHATSRGTALRHLLAFRTDAPNSLDILQTGGVRLGPDEERSRRGVKMSIRQPP